ncbi:MAG: hypothetical protein RIA71_07855 [Oceanicaulis sp.]
MSEEKKPARDGRTPAPAQPAEPDPSARSDKPAPSARQAERAEAGCETRVVIEVRGGGYDGAGLADISAGHSLAQLFEGSVQNQLHAANILAATTARCVNMILTGGARERAAELDALIREDR